MVETVFDKNFYAYYVNYTEYLYTTIHYMIGYKWLLIKEFKCCLSDWVNKWSHEIKLATTSPTIIFENK